MGLVVVGMNHRTAPVALRERAAFGAEELPRALEEFLRRAPGAEAVILSTCNRVEVIAFADGDVYLADAAARFLAESRRIPRRTLAKRLYRIRGREAIAHVFRVAASLDSMVPGESQILAQAKEAYLAAANAGATGKHLNVLYQWAFRAAKRVHTHTKIARHKVSVSSVAVDLARETLGDLSQKTVLVLGAGETGRLALRSFVEAGVGKLVVTSRTAARARSVARTFGGKAAAWKDLGRRLAEADVALVATASRDYVLTPGEAAEAMRNRRRALVVIDVAVPRNAHPSVGNVPGVTLFNIDDLERIVAENVDRRARELERGLQLVDDEVLRFEAWLEGHEAEELVGRLVRRVTEASRAALDKLWARFPGLDADRRRQIAETVARSLRRSLHGPIEDLKKHPRPERRSDERKTR